MVGLRDDSVGLEFMVPAQQMVDDVDFGAFGSVQDAAPATGGGDGSGAESGRWCRHSSTMTMKTLAHSVMLRPSVTEVRVRLWRRWYVCHLVTDVDFGTGDAAPAPAPVIEGGIMVEEWRILQMRPQIDLW